MQAKGGQKTNINHENHYEKGPRGAVNNAIAWYKDKDKNRVYVPEPADVHRLAKKRACRSVPAAACPMRKLMCIMAPSPVWQRKDERKQKTSAVSGGVS